ncbi:Sodium/calcium exchanger protein-domain-containing protein [Peziza echinospora]|nr:Sodium/calcium exchanger protein-domain-containing protein [Peziza echinospora]
MPELKRRSSSAAPTPHSWELEGEPGGSSQRAQSPTRSTTRSINSRPQDQAQPPQTGEAAGGDIWYSESNESTGTVRRIPAEGTVAGEDAYFPERSSRHDRSSNKQTSRASSAASSNRGKVLSADKKTRRPALSRRGSAVPTSYQKAHPEFSVDDNESEVEEDLQSRTLSSIHGSTGYSQMRRQAQLRRRATGVDVIEEGDGDVTERFDSDEEDEANDGAEVEQAVGDESYEPSEADSAESFTLKDRQQAINRTHPFGIRIWKPALYKKDRSVQRTAEGDIHSTPGASIGLLLSLVNILWVILFGWWLALASLLAGVSCYVFYTASAKAYGRVFFGLSWYLLYPFGHFVEFEQEEAYMEEDEGEGRSISEYEQWQAGDLEGGGTFFGPQTPRSIIGRRRASVDSSGETESLLGPHFRRGYDAIDSPTRGYTKRRLFGRGDWTIGRIIFFAWFYFVIAPLLLLVSLICWWLVFTIPMAKLTSLLVSHLRRHPLALSFHSADSHSRRAGAGRSPQILLCTYRAVGWKYYKYTIDGTNIFFINLMSVVIFCIVDFYLFAEYLEMKSFITKPATIFTLALSSVIPLAYFIGQAVASISAQSSMGMGATINALFSTIVEVFLYIVALDEGKGRLVEGSIIGSILAGILFMPGISMCSGAIVRKTQRFNARSAGVTSTMLLFAIIGAFAPTLFYQIYGTYELSCSKCHGKSSAQNCQRCIFSQVPAATDTFYYDAVLPFTYIAATFLFISYMIGLWFTLRTHAAVIWQSGVEPPHNSFIVPAVAHRAQRDMDNSTGYQTETVRTNTVMGKDSQMYKGIIGRGLANVGMRQEGAVPTPVTTTSTAHPGQSLHIIPPRSGADERAYNAGSQSPVAILRDANVAIPGLSSEQNARIVRGVAEVAAAAATAAVQDHQRLQEHHHNNYVRKNSNPAIVHSVHSNNDNNPVHFTVATEPNLATVPEVPSGGHDAPNWGRVKSAVILMGATILYAIVAEILVKTVDVVLDNIEIDEKFLGITLFALVPNTTEFLNAISFAMNGNIALSMEIGSAYALQVCLLQIPALVAWSAYSMASFPADQINTHTFTLIFPQWDLVTVILCVFLLSYMYGEGKSNYFKGSILILSYLTVMMGFYFSSYAEVPMNSRNYSLENVQKQIGSWSRASGYTFEI